MYVVLALCRPFWKLCTSTLCGQLATATYSLFKSQQKTARPNTPATLAQYCVTTVACAYVVGYFSKLKKEKVPKI